MTENNLKIKLKVTNQYQKVNKHKKTRRVLQEKLLKLNKYSKKPNINIDKDIYLKASNFKKSLVQYSFMLEKDRKKFAKNTQFKHKKTGTIVGLKEKNQTLEYLQNMKFQEYGFKTQQLQELNQGKMALFVTITLAPRFHSTINKKKNTSFNGDLIVEGYQILQKTFESIRKRVSDEFKKMSYIRVAEPHEDLTPHFHILYWVDEKDFEKLKEIITKEIKRNIKNNEGLGFQFDIEKVIEKENSNVTAYITKYLSKNTKSNNDLRYHDGYYRFFGITMFTSSQVPISSKYYRILRHGVKETKEDLRGLNYLNFGSFCLENVQVETTTLEVKALVDNIEKEEQIIIDDNVFCLVEIQSKEEILSSKKYKIQNEVKSPKYKIKVDRKIIYYDDVKKVINSIKMYDENDISISQNLQYIKEDIRDDEEKIFFNDDDNVLMELIGF